jgi:hypothetical protein
MTGPFPAEVFDQFIVGLWVNATQYQAASRDVDLRNRATFPKTEEFSLNSLQTPNQVSLTFQTNPPGRAYSVNGIPYSTSQTLSFPCWRCCVPGGGDSAANLPRHSPCLRFWSQGGPAVQSLVVPTSNTTYTIQYNTEHQLTTAVSPAGSGSLLGGNYYLAGSTVSLTPSANPGYAFLNYAGDLSGTTIPGSVVMNSPKSVTANFAGIPSLTIARTAATGLPTSRIWTLTVTNSAPVGAANAHIASLALTQTAGATCTSPLVASPRPGSPNLGSIAAWWQCGVTRYYQLFNLPRRGAFYLDGESVRQRLFCHPISIQFIPIGVLTDVSILFLAALLTVGPALASPNVRVTLVPPTG